jgi:homoserine dehydrogenase
MHKNKGACMRIQLVGLGHVGQNLIELIDEKKELLKSKGLDLHIVSVSDSKGSAIDKRGLILSQVLRYKKFGWEGFGKYVEGYTALDAIRKIESDVIVELTPSTFDGEPGLSNIKAALAAKKNIVTANKGPLVVAYRELMKTTMENGVKLLCEATVGAHVPVFCLVDSCFKVDELQSVKGILNATTNFVIGEMQRGKGFQEAIDEAVRAGWAETDYADDVDGIDAARKLVIMADALFGEDARLEDVKIEGIRHVEALVKAARKENRKVKLICEIIRNKDKLEMTVSPQQVPLDDALATVNEGNMAIKFGFKTSKEIFVSAQFLGPKQTAYAVLNDIVRTNTKPIC